MASFPQYPPVLMRTCLVGKPAVRVELWDLQRPWAAGSPQHAVNVKLYEPASGEAEPVVDLDVGIVGCIDDDQAVRACLRACASELPEGADVSDDQLFDYGAEPGEIPAGSFPWPLQDGAVSPAWPSMAEVAARLEAQARPIAPDCHAEDCDESGCPGCIDVRLQCEDSGWSIHTGSAQDDQDHRGYWGSSVATAGQTDFAQLADDLLDQAKESWFTAY
jgi:hypothetical protein